MANPVQSVEGAQAALSERHEQALDTFVSFWGDMASRREATAVGRERVQAWEQVAKGKVLAKHRQACLIVGLADDAVLVDQKHRVVKVETPRLPRY